MPKSKDIHLRVSVYLLELVIQTLGVLSVPFFFLFLGCERGYAACVNRSFILVNTNLFPIYGILHTLSVYFLVAWFFARPSTVSPGAAGPGVSEFEVIAAMVLYFLRNSTIAIKYAFMEPEFYQSTLVRVVSERELTARLILAGWMRPASWLIYRELLQASGRLGLPWKWVAFPGAEDSEEAIDSMGESIRVLEELRRVGGGAKTDDTCMPEEVQHSMSVKRQQSALFPVHETRSGSLEGVRWGQKDIPNASAALVGWHVIHRVIRNGIPIAWARFSICIGLLYALCPVFTLAATRSSFITAHPLDVLAYICFAHTSFMNIALNLQFVAAAASDLHRRAEVLHELRRCIFPSQSSFQNQSKQDGGEDGREGEEGEEGGEGGDGGEEERRRGREGCGEERRGEEGGGSGSGDGGGGGGGVGRRVKHEHTSLEEELNFGGGGTEGGGVGRGREEGVSVRVRRGRVGLGGFDSRPLSGDDAKFMFPIGVGYPANTNAVVQIACLAAEIGRQFSDRIAVYTAQFGALLLFLVIEVAFSPLRTVLGVTGSYDSMAIVIHVTILEFAFGVIFVAQIAAATELNRSFSRLAAKLTFCERAIADRFWTIPTDDVETRARVAEALAALDRGDRMLKAYIDINPARVAGIPASFTMITAVAPIAAAGFLASLASFGLNVSGFAVIPN